MMRDIKSLDELLSAPQAIQKCMFLLMLLHTLAKAFLELLSVMNLHMLFIIIRVFLCNKMEHQSEQHWIILIWSITELDIRI